MIQPLTEAMKKEAKKYSARIWASGRRPLNSLKKDTETDYRAALQGPLVTGLVEALEHCEAKHDYCAVVEEALKKWKGE